MKIPDKGGDDIWSRERELTALLAAAPDPSDHTSMRDYAHALIALGCAVLPISPGLTVPVDMRTPKKRNADDRAAQDAAYAAGKSNWRKVRSDAGVHLATDDADVLDGYLDRYRRAFGDRCAVNLAVSLGRSRLVAIDCDTDVQLKRFLADAAVPDDTEPTVRTPGVCDPDSGQWVHRDGGHFWFAVPDGIEMPDDPQSMTLGDNDSDNYAVLWGSGKYVLIPPRRLSRQR